MKQLLLIFIITTFPYYSIKAQDDPIITIIDVELLGLNDGDEFFIQCYEQDPEWTLFQGEEGDVSAMDDCEGEIEVEFSQMVVGEGNCPEDRFIQRIELKWTATNDCQGESTLTLYMLLEDKIAPVIFNVPADITVECNDLSQPPQVIALDECSVPDLVYNEEGDCASGTITRTWTATDACGNLTVERQFITIIPTIPTIPTLSQWGIIALGMIMLILGLVGLKQRKVIFG